MSLYFALKKDGTSVVNEKDNPIQTKHTSTGGSVEIPLYIFNDGKRKGVPNDSNPPPLIYTNIQVQIEGVSHTLQQQIAPSQSSVNLEFESVEGWNIGTIIKHGTERMRVQEISSPTSLVVQREYTLDGGGSSVIMGHNVGDVFIAETKSVSLALPNANDPTYDTTGVYGQGGEALTLGLDPTLLTQSIDSREESNIVKSNSGSKYHEGCLIKIDNEVMKVVSISGNDLTVRRGYNNTQREQHTNNAIIYCVGLVDILVGADDTKTHKIFLKNTPPTGLVTQKKRDVKLVLVADEEPL